MELAIVVAVSQNDVIGRGGTLPWHLPADLAWFRKQTLGHHVIMGRRTYESIGRPLPQRTNLVLSRDPEFAPAGCTRVSDLDAALQIARSSGENVALVIGGAQVYAEALPLADRVYLTRVHAHVEGDTFWPPFTAEWIEVHSETHEADPRNAYAYTFTVLELRNARDKVQG